jgi:anti-sigma factor RsiW
MTAAWEHIEFDELNDYVDGRLPSDRRSIVSAHLAGCRNCQAEHNRLVTFMDSVESLSDSVLPPDAVWEGIRTAIDERKDAVLPIAGVGSQSARVESLVAQTRGGWWARPSFLIAAGLVLVMASSGATAFVLRMGQERKVVQGTPREDAPAGARMLPASFRQAESEYLVTIAQLRETLRAHGESLKPETIAAVDHSLSVIDAAIEEARTALLADPTNLTLLDLLTASYERKLDLLRRAANLGART